MILAQMQFDSHSDSIYASRSIALWAAEIVEPRGLSVTALAQHLGVTRQAMSALLNGRSGLSAEMAIRFEKAFGLRADTLLKMQAAHELALARANEGNIRVAPIAA